MSLADPDYGCPFNITANTDVGGPGVIISFIAIAGFTISLAFVPALEVFTQWLHSHFETSKKWPFLRRKKQDCAQLLRNHGYAVNRTRTFRSTALRISERQKGKQPATDIEGQSHIDMELRSIDNPPAHQVQEAGVQDQSLGEQHVAQRPSIWKIRERHFGQIAKSHQQGSYPYSTGKIVKLLRALCDLQIATGLAIIVAGIGQWDSIDFYHEELVNSYYGLTLNSFWATRVSYMDLESEEDTWALLLRRATVLASSIMSIVWQFRLYFRETASKVWSDDVGPCFRYLDRSNPLFGTIFWPTGLTIFCVALASSLFEQTRWADKWYFLATEWVSQFLWSRFQAALNRDEIVNNGTSTTSRSPPKLLKAILKVMEVLAYGLAVTVYFLFLQLLDVWSYGNGFYPLTWLAYFGLYCWNVLDIVSAVLLNRELIQDEEWAWGFGQILPMVLILSVLFLVVDVIRGRTEIAEGPSTRAGNTKDADTTSNSGNSQACPQCGRSISNPETRTSLQQADIGGPSASTSP